MSVDLSTTYLGLELENPLMVGACPLTEDLDNLRRLEDAGAAAVVMPSLFEEQVERDSAELERLQEQGTESFAESLTYFPDQEDFFLGPDNYLKHVEQAKSALSIPVIGSINGISQGGWVRYAKLIQEAGADALELNVYFIAADVTMSGQDVEQLYLDVVAAVAQSVSIPVSVKVGPYFSSPGHMGKRLLEAGAGGLTLFNRFLQPDIDLDELTISPRLSLSTQQELLLSLRWIAILRSHTRASLALTGGIHDSADVLKALLAGADVIMIVSALYAQGLEHLKVIREGMCRWMEGKDYESVRQLRGSMSQANCSDPAAFERGNYLKAITSFSADPAKHPEGHSVS